MLLCLRLLPWQLLIGRKPGENPTVGDLRVSVASLVAVSMALPGLHGTKSGVLPVPRRRGSDDKSDDDDDYIRNTVLRIHAANCVTIAITGALQIVNNDRTYLRRNSDAFVPNTTDGLKSGEGLKSDPTADRGKSIPFTKSMSSDNILPKLTVKRYPFLRDNSFDFSILSDRKPMAYMRRLEAIISDQSASGNSVHSLGTHENPQGNLSGSMVASEASAMKEGKNSNSKKETPTVSSESAKVDSKLGLESYSEHDAQVRQAYNETLTPPCHKNIHTVIGVHNPIACHTVSVGLQKRSRSCKGALPAEHVPIARSCSLNESPGPEGRVCCNAPPNTPELSHTAQPTPYTDNDTAACELPSNRITARTATGIGSNQDNMNAIKSPQGLSSNTQIETESDEIITEQSREALASEYDNTKWRPPANRIVMPTRKLSTDSNLASIVISNLMLGIRQRESLFRSYSRSLITDTEKRPPLAQKRHSLGGGLPSRENIGFVISACERRRIMEKIDISAVGPNARVLGVDTTRKSHDASPSTSLQSPIRAFSGVETAPADMQSLENPGALRKRLSTNKLELENSDTVRRPVCQQRHSRDAMNAPGRSSTGSIGAHQQPSVDVKVAAFGNGICNDQKTTIVTEDRGETKKHAGDILDVSKVTMTRSLSPTRGGKELHGKVLYSVDSYPDLLRVEKKMISTVAKGTNATEEVFCHPEIPVNFPLQISIHGFAGNSPKRSWPKWLPTPPASPRNSSSVLSTDQRNKGKTAINQEDVTCSFTSPEQAPELTCGDSPLKSKASRPSGENNVDRTSLVRYRRKLEDSHQANRAGSGSVSSCQRRILRQVDNMPTPRHQPFKEHQREGRPIPDPDVPTSVKSIVIEVVSNESDPTPETETSQQESSTSLSLSGDQLLSTTVTGPVVSEAADRRGNNSNMPSEQPEGFPRSRHFRCFLDLFRRCCCGVSSDDSAADH